MLGALLWGFHNAHTGRCFPSYEAIAAKAECCRDTVYEAIKARNAAYYVANREKIRAKAAAKRAARKRQGT